jgi:hypothetical protein
MTEETAVGLFGAVNIGLVAASRLVDNIGPVLHDLLTATQCAVAVVSVIYIWRKANAIKRNANIMPKKKKKKVIRY